MFLMLFGKIISSQAIALPLGYVDKSIENFSNVSKEKLD